jgi:hypothetical protein
MEYKRLTEKAENGKPYFDGCLKCDLESDCGLCPYFASGLNRLAELEDKIEKGTLIELPCKVGDTVYVINGAMLLCEMEISYFSIIGGLKEFYAVNNDEHYGYYLYEKDLNDDWFLTREEAEKRLKELQNG